MSAAIATAMIRSIWAPPSDPTSFSALVDMFSDVDAFVDAVLAEIAAMAADGTRPTRSGPSRR